jgi:predicted transcriptional regulator
LVEENDQVIGIVSLSDTGKIGQPDWGRTPIKAIMTPIEKIHFVSISDSADDVLSSMQTHSINQVPVVENDRVVGWIDREQLVRALSVYMESRSG